MEIKVSSLATAAKVIVGIFILVVVLLIFFAPAKNSINDSQNNNIVLTGDEQILDLVAKGGYSPMQLEAQAGKTTVLRVSTTNTFDCSSALQIPKLGVRKSLPPTGKTDILIEAQAAGTVINGTCSMGMYNFSIKFI